MNELELKICNLLQARLGCKCTYMTEPEFACETISKLIGVVISYFIKKSGLFFEVNKK